MNTLVKDRAPIGTESDGLKVWVELPPEGLSTATVNLRWSITTELAERLRQEDALNPHLLVLVTNGVSEMARYVFPLKNARYGGWVPFHRAGCNIVHVGIVWEKPYGSLVAELANRRKQGILTRKYPLSDASRNRLDEARTALEVYKNTLKGQSEPSDDQASKLARLRGKIQLLNEEFTAQRRAETATLKLCTEYSSYGSLPVELSFAVEVPDGLFAKPWRVTKWLASRYPGMNWFQEALKENGCGIRKRMLANIALSVLIAVPALIVCVALLALLAAWYTVAFILIVVMLFIGARGIDYSPLASWKPGWSPADISDICDISSSVWWHRKTGEKVDSGNHSSYEPRHRIFWLINPPALVALGLIVLILTNAGGAAVVSAWALGFAAVVGIAALIRAFVAKPVMSKCSSLKDDMVKHRRAAAAQAIADLADQRDSRPTVKLRLTELKYKICKPVQR